jgi:hypothetical protein
MRLYLAFMCFISFSFFGICQTWETVVYLPDNLGVDQLEVVSESNIYVAVDNLKFIRWDGSQWNDIGNFNPNYVPYFEVIADDDIYATHNDYLSGDGQSTYNYIAHWDGNNWTNAGDLNVGRTISKIKVLSPTEIYAVGNFELPGYNWKPVAKYNGSGWSVLGEGTSNAGAYETSGNLWVGGTHNIYATSGYSGSGEVLVKRWDGTNWQVLNDSNNIVNRLSETFVVSENEVYSFGTETANGNSCIALWDGLKWEPLGNIKEELDLSNSAYNGRISYRVVKSDQIYAVGSAFREESFSYIIAKWNGSSWEEVGNFDGDNAAEVLDILDGYLYVAGRFTELNSSGQRVTVIKRFFIDSFFIEAAANISERGAVNGSGVFSSSDVVTLTALPEEGFHFLFWSEEGVQVSNNPVYEFEVDSDRNLIAHFEPNSYTISVNVNPNEGGVVTGSGVYNFGDVINMVATPFNGYSFLNWTENGEIVSINPQYQFVLESDRNFTANFELSSFLITTGANPEEGGSTTGGGTYGYGDLVNLTAVPEKGYSFINWTENGHVVSEVPVYDLIAESNKNVIANFQIDLALSDQIIFKPKIYPNPFIDFINIQTYREPIEKVQVFDLSGRLVMNITGNFPNGLKLFAENLKKGVYLLMINTKHNKWPIQILKE